MAWEVRILVCVVRQAVDARIRKTSCRICAGYDIPDRWQDGHVFSLVAQPDSGNILAGCCSDGSLR